MNKLPEKPVFEGEILICEDNGMIQELICDRLAKLGLKTTIAVNGLEGVEKVKDRIKNGIKPFDLIFMDIFMPVMNGFEAAIQINELNTRTNIIAMTANDIPAERVQYAAHGMLDYLNKPFTARELTDCLAKYLKLANLNHSSANNQNDSSLVSVDFMSADQQDEEKLKIKLINNFVNNNKNIYNEIIKAAEDGDIKLAHRLAHTLKGSAGMFNKTRLQKAAEKAESLLENEKNSLNESAMNILKTELDAVLNEFIPLASEDSSDRRLSDADKKSGLAAVSLGPLGNNNKKQDANPADKNLRGLESLQKMPALLDELEIMLDGGDVHSLKTADSLRSILEEGWHSAGESPVNEPLVDEPLVRELIHQIEYFEFDMAIKTLARIKEIMNGEQS